VLMTALGSPLNGRLVDMAGSRIIILIGLLIAAAGLFMISRLPTDKTAFYLACGLLGFGLSMRAALNYIMLNEVSEIERASSQGMLLIFVSVGQITGASFISIMAASYSNVSDGYRAAFILMSGMATLLAILAVFLKSRKSEIRSYQSRESINTNNS